MCLFIVCGNIQILINFGILFMCFGVPFMDVGVVSYLYMVSLVLCPSLLQIHPAGSLFLEQLFVIIPNLYLIDLPIKSNNTNNANNYSYIKCYTNQTSVPIVKTS